MRRYLFVLCLGVSGCAQYAQVQMDLVTQARKGVAICQKSTEGHGQVIERLTDLQRTRLNEAFDADVRDNPALSADWVVEHRKAYAAALLVLAQEQQQLQQARKTESQNLASIDQALTKLYWLESIQDKAFTFNGEEK